MKTANPRKFLVGLATLASMVAPIATAAPAARLEVRPVQPVLVESTGSQRAVIQVSLTGAEVPSTDRHPVDIALVLDRSGSMSGEKLEKAKDAALMVVDRLSKGDIFSLVAYDDDVRVLVPATKVDDKSEIRRIIRTIEPGGSTALFGGVSKGIAEARKFKSATLPARVVLVSDGMANVGPSSPAELASLGRVAGRDGIPITTVGLGLGYNEDLMMQLAQASDGNHDFAEGGADLARIFDREVGAAMTVVAQEIQIHIHCPEGVRPVRVLDREAEIRGNDVMLPLNQVNGGQQKYILVEVELPAASKGKVMNVAEVSASYEDLLGKKRETVSGSASVSFTGDVQVARRSVDRKAKVAEVRAQANILSKKAVELRDQGQAPAASAMMGQAAVMLEQTAAEYDDEALRQESKDAAASAKAAKSEESWGKERKSLRSKQYKTSNQAME